MAGVPVTIDPGFVGYEPIEGVSGRLVTAGSDTMNNLANRWASRFTEFHPAVSVTVDQTGSGTAPPKLRANQAQLGMMSREMTAEEVSGIVSELGIAPTPVRVAIDCVAIYVHQDNPVGPLTFEQLERVFGASGGELTWADLGVSDPAYAPERVRLYGRQASSGTYKFFKDLALGGADFKASIAESPGSGGVVQSVARDPFGIGYSGLGYETSDVRTVPIAVEAGEEPVGASGEAALDGSYPLRRFLLMYLVFDPRVGLDPAREAFTRFVLSREGQELVTQDGEFPVSAEVAREELRKLGLEPGF